MSALTVGHDPEQSWDGLVRFWEEMDWPEGSKVEIVEVPAPVDVVIDTAEFPAEQAGPVRRR
jgi:hypothetical protein